MNPFPSEPEPFQQTAAIPSSGSLSDRILATTQLAHPVLRNLQITNTYHELTLAFTEAMDRQNVCWCAFATWASKQAGRFIRREQVPEALLELLGTDEDGRPAERPWYWFLIPKWLLRSRLFLSYARCTVDDVSAQIAAGNLLVFARLAPIFAGFLDLIGERAQPEPGRLEAFLNSLSQDAGTGEEIRKAFTFYYQARFEPDPKKKAEWIYVGNVLVGLHEQVRLQGAIEGAMKAPIRQAIADPERRLGSLPIPVAVRKLIGTVFLWAMEPTIRRFEERWQCLATDCLMTLAAPTGTLRLGQDLPPLPGGEYYPELLRELTLAEVVELVRQVDLTPDTIVGSGARDWSRLTDRMNYIADLFRSRQQDPTLGRCPFSPEQVEAIVGGRVPEGAL